MYKPVDPYQLVKFDTDKFFLPQESYNDYANFERIISTYLAIRRDYQ